MREVLAQQSPARCAQIGLDHVFTCDIQPAQIAWESTLFRRALFARFRSQARALARASDLPEPKLPEPSFDSAAPSFRGARPELAWVTYGDHLRLDAGIPVEARLRYACALAASVANGSRDVLDGRFDGVRSMWQRDALERLDRQLLRETGENPYIRPADEEVARRGAVGIASARQWLGEIWPAVAAVVDVYVDDTVWFASPRYRSSTEIRAFGAVFVCPTGAWSVPHFIETLVHESGHLSLLVKQSIDPLLANPDETSVSPLRADARSLACVLHATFVLARMVEGHLRYLSRCRDLPCEAAAAALLRDRARRLADGARQLERSAKPTARGEALLTSLAETARALQKEVPS